MSETARGLSAFAMAATPLDERHERRARAHEQRHSPESASLDAPPAIRWRHATPPPTDAAPVLRSPTRPRGTSNGTASTRTVLLQRSDIRVDEAHTAAVARARQDHDPQREDNNRATDPSKLTEDNGAWGDQPSMTKEGDRMEVYRAQRERLRRMQRRYAELQQAMGRPIEPSADFDFISPVRPPPQSRAQQRREEPSPPGLSLHNGLVLGLGRDGNSTRATVPQPMDAARPRREQPPPAPAPSPAMPTEPPSTRRPAVVPSEVLQEFDENFWGSFHENESPIRPPRRAAARADTTPSAPPFREKISHSRSTSDDEQNDEQRVLDEDGNPYVEERLPTSEDVGAHAQFSSDYDSVPEISVSPPLSPVPESSRAARRPSPPQSTPFSQRQSAQTNKVRSRPSGPDTVSTSGFPLWGVAFLAGCAVVGVGGYFVEELLELFGAIVKTSRASLAPREQREMSQRLDLLQQELHSFRAATSEMERQSQSMVLEVRHHLARMKTERERQQETITREMKTLREYVQSVTRELIEREQQDLQKRLAATIREANEAKKQSVPAPTTLPRDEDMLSENKAPEPLSSTRQEQKQQQQQDKVTTTEATNEEEEDQRAGDPVVPPEPERQVEPEVLEEIKPEPVRPPKISVVPSPTTADVSAPAAPSPSSSLVIWELLLLLVLVGLVAAYVSHRVRTAHRRKQWFQTRRMRRFPAAAPRTPLATEEDESDSVETVAFMGASDDSAEEVTMMTGDDERSSNGRESPSGQSSWSSASSQSDEEISPVAPSRDPKQLQGILKHDRSERLDSGMRQRARGDTSVRRSPRLQQTRESLAFMR
ncbi:hypothetical protein ATCC90586_000578 [Pythium insidiosum]|nr:hypothetical protein ATCC90586_000578 [Pythium insidiosum]